MIHQGQPATETWQSSYPVEDRKKIVYTLLNTLKEISGNDFDLKNNEEAAQEFEKLMFIHSNTKEKYLKVIRQKLHSLRSGARNGFQNQSQNGQTHNGGEAGMQFQGGQRMKMGGSVNNTSTLNQAHPNYLKYMQQSQQSRQQQTMKMYSLMMNSDVNNYNQPMKTQYFSSQQNSNITNIQYQQVVSYISNIPIPQALLSKISNLPSGVNTWSQVYECLQKKILPDSAIPIIKDLHDTHIQLVYRQHQQQKLNQINSQRNSNPNYSMSTNQSPNISPIIPQQQLYNVSNIPIQKSLSLNHSPNISPIVNQQQPFNVPISNNLNVNSLSLNNLDSLNGNSINLQNTNQMHFFLQNQKQSQKKNMNMSKPQTHHQPNLVTLSPIQQQINPNQYLQNSYQHQFHHKNYPPNQPIQQMQGQNQMLYMSLIQPHTHTNHQPHLQTQQNQQSNIQKIPYLQITPQDIMKYSSDAVILLNRLQENRSIQSDLDRNQKKNFIRKYIIHQKKKLWKKQNSQNLGNGLSNPQINDIENLKVNLVISDGNKINNNASVINDIDPHLVQRRHQDHNQNNIGTLNQQPIQHPSIIPDKNNINNTPINSLNLNPKKMIDYKMQMKDMNFSISSQKRMMNNYHLNNYNSFIDGSVNNNITNKNSSNIDLNNNISSTINKKNISALDLNLSENPNINVINSPNLNVNNNQINNISNIGINLNSNTNVNRSNSNVNLDPDIEFNSNSSNNKNLKYNLNASFNQSHNVNNNSNQSKHISNGITIDSNNIESQNFESNTISNNNINNRSNPVASPNNDSNFTFEMNLNNNLSSNHNQGYMFNHSNNQNSNLSTNSNNIYKNNYNIKTVSNNMNMNDVQENINNVHRQRNSDSFQFILPTLTDDLKQRLRKLVEKILKNNIYLRDITSLLSEKEKSLIRETFIKVTQQYSNIDSVISYFFIITQNEEGTKRLLQMKFIIKKLLEGFKKGVYLGEHSLLLKLQKQYQKYFDHVKEHFFLKRQQLQNQQNQTQQSVLQPNRTSQHINNQVLNSSLPQNLQFFSGPSTVKQQKTQQFQRNQSQDPQNQKFINFGNNVKSPKKNNDNHKRLSSSVFVSNQSSPHNYNLQSPLKIPYHYNIQNQNIQATQLKKVSSAKKKNIFKNSVNLGISLDSSNQGSANNKACANLSHKNIKENTFLSYNTINPGSYSNDFIKTTNLSNVSTPIENNISSNLISTSNKTPNSLSSTQSSLNTSIKNILNNNSSSNSTKNSPNDSDLNDTYDIFNCVELDSKMNERKNLRSTDPEKFFFSSLANLLKLENFFEKKKDSSLLPKNETKFNNSDENLDDNDNWTCDIKPGTICAAFKQIDFISELVLEDVLFVSNTNAIIHNTENLQDDKIISNDENFNNLIKIEKKSDVKDFFLHDSIDFCEWKLSIASIV